MNREKVIPARHTAANTGEAMPRMAVMAAEEILKVLDGETPLNVINPEFDFENLFLIMLSEFSIAIKYD